MINIPTKKQMRAALARTSNKERKMLTVLSALLIISGIGFFWSLNARFLISVPQEGGSLKEGIIGTPNFINPIFATTESDKDLVELLYTGLTRRNENGQLVPALTDTYDVTQDGLEYTFYLKKNLRWSDGKELTTQDVAFTITTIQNQSTRSIQKPNWEGIEVQIVDTHTIKFILKKPYAPFLANTTLGIIPKHIWGKFGPEELIGAQTNVENIVGAGPYKIKSVQKRPSGSIEKINLTSNKHFVLGKPFIKKLELNFFLSEKELREALKTKKIDSAGLHNKQGFEQVLSNKQKMIETPLPRIFGVFFNGNFVNRSLQDKNVRKALALSIDKQRLIKDVLSGSAQAITSAIPDIHIESKEEKIESVENNLETAIKLLEKANWKLNEETGIREKSFSKKSTTRLEFDLVTVHDDQLIEVVRFLEETWEQLGVRVNIKTFDVSKLEENVFGPRKYDALLFGEIIGLEVDPFAFWHSSQRLAPGLNIALYANKKVDSLLENIREERDKEKRDELLYKFVLEVDNDVPAIFLYAPLYTYLVPKNLKGIEISSLNTPADRFSQVHKWFIKTQKVWRIFAK